MQKETGRLTVGNSRYESKSYDIRLLVVLKKQFCVQATRNLDFVDFSFFFILSIFIHGLPFSKYTNY